MTIIDNNVLDLIFNHLKTNKQYSTNLILVPLTLFAHFKVSVTVGGGGGRHVYALYLKKTVRCRCIKVHINKFVIHLRIISQE